MQNGFLEVAWDVLTRDKETQAHMRAPSTSSGNSMWMWRDVLQGSRGEGDEPRSASEGRHSMLRDSRGSLKSSYMTSPRVYCAAAR